MDVATLEQAGDTILAPPNVVSAEQRRLAEAVFTNLKHSLTLDVALQIIRSTSHAFVLHQMGQAAGEIVLRDWALIDNNEVETAYKMLIEFVASRTDIPAYVVSVYLQSAAMIIKRGALDKKTGDPEILYETIKGLLSNADIRMQSIGCQLISSICEQFSSSWRNSKFSITWDFHLAAKTEFEKSGLRRLLDMAVSTLAVLTSQSDILSNAFEKRLCEKFLEVAESAFSWNFSARFFRRIFSLNQSSTSFRPPGSWQDLLANDAFFRLFFQLHAKVRTDENLSMHSLCCLVQLASLSGDLMAVPDFSAHFVSLFIEGLLDLFPTGPLPHEVHHFCTILNRLFMYRPIQSLMKMEENLRTRFFTYVAQYTEHLTIAAMHEAIANSNHSLHASLSLIYDSWCMLLRGRWRTGLDAEVADQIEQQLIATPTWSIITAFFNATQAAPYGCRPREAVIDEHEDDDDETKDDRQLYQDLLNPLSGLACYCVEPFIDTFAKTLNDRLVRFADLTSRELDSAALASWHEDMHWLMLIMATSVVGEDMDGACHTQPEVFDLSALMVERRLGLYDEQTRDLYLVQCIERPTEPRPVNADVDPFIKLVGELLAWACVEHRILSTPNSMHLLSPQLSRSTAFALRRVLNASTNIIDPNESDQLCSPVLPHQGRAAEVIVGFVLEKAFTMLQKFTGETKVCADAVALVGGLVDNRASLLASSPALFAHLSAVDIARCPVRGELMKVLVLIGAAANDVDLQKNMFTQILEPLASRYASVLASVRATPSSTAHESDLVDLLQCFDGVARASQGHSAATLFTVVEPVLVTCAELMKFSQSAPVVTAILVLMQDVTTKISIYLDEKQDSMKLYTYLLETVDAYQSTHAKRFVGMNSDDEEKAADLVLFMEILSNVLSRDILESADDRQLTGSQVAMTSLEMLLCIMSESLLEHPEVATKFYRLLLYLTEFCPESLAFMNANLLNSMVECLKAGLTSKFGSEITSTCLESLAEVAAFFGSNRDKCTQQLLDHFHAILPMVFEACLENSAEASLFSEACSSLYAIICFDMNYFNEYVHELLARKNNAAAASKLSDAFHRLFPEEPKFGRRERVDFRRRMEKFLGDIQGLLWIH